MLDSGFFPSTSGTTNANGAFVGNKAKGASFLANTFYRVFGNGISAIPTAGFGISIKAGLTITVQPGWGILNGYPFELLEALDITLVPTSSPTTHYIGVKLVKDVNGVVTGFDGDDVKAMSSFDPDLALAFGYVDLVANATGISASDVHDVRFENAYCGISEGHKAQLIALAEAYAEAIADATSAYNTFVANKTAEYNAFVADMTADYEAVVADIIANGIIAHVNNHKYGGSDALPPANIGQYGVVEKDANGVVAAAATALIDRDVTANDSLVSSDFAKNIRVNSASAVTITVPSGLPTGFYCFVTRKGAGAVTIAAGSGVTVNAAGNRYKIAEQQERVGIAYDGASNTYLLVGSFIA